MPFPTVQLNDGHKIPAIAYGTGSVNKSKDVHEYVELAIEAGFSHIDTAQVYENEESVGTAIRESGLARSDLFITSKYWKGDIQDALQCSLSKIGVKQLDLYLVHIPAVIEHDVESGWRQFEQAKEAGLVKSIGVSNFTVEDLQKLVKTAKIKPAVNQINLHPYNYTEHKDLLEYHAKHGIITEAYGSLAPITKYPGGPVDKALTVAAQRLGITPTQVIFLWLRAKGIVIVTTSSSKEHLQQYLAVGDLPPLTDEEIVAIDEAGARGPPAVIGSSKTILRTLSYMIFFALFFLLWLRQSTCHGSTAV